MILVDFFVIYITEALMAKKLKKIETPIEEIDPQTPITTYVVSLPYLPSMEIEALNEEEAIKTYNKYLSVNKTIHKYTCMLMQN